MYVKSRQVPLAGLNLHLLGADLTASGEALLKGLQGQAGVNASHLAIWAHAARKQIWDTLADQLLKKAMITRRKNGQLKLTDEEWSAVIWLKLKRDAMWELKRKSTTPDVAEEPGVGASGAPTPTAMGKEVDSDSGDPYVDVAKTLWEQLVVSLPYDEASVYALRFMKLTPRKIAVYLRSEGIFKSLRGRYVRHKPVKHIRKEERPGYTKYYYAFTVPKGGKRISLKAASDELLEVLEETKAVEDVLESLMTRQSEIAQALHPRLAGLADMTYDAGQALLILQQWEQTRPPGIKVFLEQVHSQPASKIPSRIKRLLRELKDQLSTIDRVIRIKVQQKDEPRLFTRVPVPTEEKKTKKSLQPLRVSGAEATGDVHEQIVALADRILELARQYREYLVSAIKYIAEAKGAEEGRVAHNPYHN